MRRINLNLIRPLCVHLVKCVLGVGKRVGVIDDSKADRDARGVSARRRGERKRADKRSDMVSREGPKHGSRLVLVASVPTHDMVCVRTLTVLD